VLFGTYRVLVDLGLGFGYHAKWLRQNATYLFGVDIFRAPLDVAKTKDVFDDLVVADALHLPFRREKRDRVTLIDLIEHLPKEEGSQLPRMLEPPVFVSTTNSKVSNRH
jgi:predicted TPR repeat methyltransferase